MAGETYTLGVRAQILAAEIYERQQEKFDDQQQSLWPNLKKIELKSIVLFTNAFPLNSPNDPESFDSSYIIMQKALKNNSMKRLIQITEITISCVQWFKLCLPFYFDLLNNIAWYSIK